MSKPKEFKYHQCMKKHEVLKEAMNYLSPVKVGIPTDESNKFEFICQCISKVVNNHPLDFSDHSGIIKIISSRLGNEWGGTLEGWLFDTHNIAWKELYKNQGRKLQKTRKAWMQSLYEEFLVKDE